MHRIMDFGTRKRVLGLIHLLPLPGTPYFQPGNTERAMAKAVQDAQALCAGGADGGLIQTIDRVYPVGEAVDPARLAAIAMIVQAVRNALPAEFHLGVQILWNASQASVGVAYAGGGSFVRCTAFVGSTHSAYGLVQADPVGLLQYVQRLGAADMRLIAEIHSMHYRSREGLPVARLAEIAAQCGAHAVEIAEPEPQRCLELMADVRRAVPELPIVLGGHTNHDNVTTLLSVADGAFVGTCFQPRGWGTAIDADRVRAYVDQVRALE